MYNNNKNVNIIIIIFILPIVINEPIIYLSYVNLIFFEESYEMVLFN